MEEHLEYLGDDVLIFESGDAKNLLCWFGGVSPLGIDREGGRVRSPGVYLFGLHVWQTAYREALSQWLSATFTQMYFLLEEDNLIAAIFTY